MILTPHGRRILVAELPAAANTFGLYVPESSREDVRRGEILALGGGCLEDLELGDVVHYARPAAVVIAVGRREYLFVEEDRVYLRELRVAEAEWLELREGLDSATGERLVSR